MDKPPADALKAALTFIESRDRLAQEVRTHISGKGFGADVVESVVQFLLERKLLNDDNTTQSLIERYSGKRSVGIEQLRAELEKLGAPEDLIEAKLAALSEPERYLDALRRKLRTGT